MSAPVAAGGIENLESWMLVYFPMLTGESWASPMVKHKCTLQNSEPSLLSWCRIQEQRIICASIFEMLFECLSYLGNPWIGKCWCVLWKPLVCRMSCSLVFAPSSPFLSSPSLSAAVRYSILRYSILLYLDHWTWDFWATASVKRSVTRSFYDPLVFFLNRLIYSFFGSFIYYLFIYHIDLSKEV